MNALNPQEPKKPFSWRNALSWLIPCLGIIALLGLYFSGSKQKSLPTGPGAFNENQASLESKSLNPAEQASQHSGKVKSAPSSVTSGETTAAAPIEKAEKKNWLLSFFSSKKSEETAPESAATEGSSKTADAQKNTTASSATKSAAEVAGTNGAPAVEPPNCFTVSYRHKPLAAHIDDESCSRHKNEIQLKHTQYNTASLCVRVDDKPVPFATLKDHPETVVIGPHAGPHSLITARYCLGKSLCKEGCKVPKDEFMDAIGGVADDSPKKANLGVWDPKSPSQKNQDILSQLDPQLKQELAETDAGRSGSVYLFKEWTQENEWAAASCEGLKSPGALQTASTQATRQPGSAQ